MKAIKAKFVGNNGSVGYEHGKNYVLLIHQGREGTISIERALIAGGYCAYGSLISFLNNWDEIETAIT